MPEKYLLEDEESSFNKKAQRRAIDCERVAKLAREAAKKAEENNQSELATTLNQKADELENAAKNWNKDLLDTENSSSESSNNNNEKNKNTSTPSTNTQSPSANSSENNETTQNNSSENNEGNQDGSSNGTGDNEQSSQETGSSNGTQNSSEQGENENTESSSDDDSVEDIFNTKQQSQGQASQQGQKEPRKPTIDEIIKQLANLPEKHKQKAILGLKDLLGITND